MKVIKPVGLFSEHCAWIHISKYDIGSILSEAPFIYIWLEDRKRKEEKDEETLDALQSHIRC